MSFERSLCHVAAALVAVGIANGLLPGEEVGEVPVYSVAEITFQGPLHTAKDSPARDVHLEVAFRHESGSPEFSVQGFFDGDGQGGIEGDVFKVRFCPHEGWEMDAERSDLQRTATRWPATRRLCHSDTVEVAWILGCRRRERPGRRWYRRSDGLHQFIFGNTHYTILTEHGLNGKPTGGNITEDMATNAKFNARSARSSRRRMSSIQCGVVRTAKVHVVSRRSTTS